MDTPRIDHGAFHMSRSSVLESWFAVSLAVGQYVKMEEDRSGSEV